MQPIKPFTITIKGEHDEQGGCAVRMAIEGTFRMRDCFQIMECILDCFSQKKDFPPKEICCLMLLDWIMDKSKFSRSVMYDMKEAKEQSEAAEGGSL